MNLHRLLEEFWMWTGLFPEKWWVTDITNLPDDPVLFPKHGDLCNTCLELINKPLSAEKQSDFLLALALDDEDEDILDQLKENATEAFLVSLLSQGISYPQSAARWQLAELLRRDIPERAFYLNQLLLDPDEYVLTRLYINVPELYYFVHPILVHNIYVHYFFYLFFDSIIL